MPQFMLGQFTAFIATALDTLLRLYMWIIIISALLSWVNPDPRNPIVRFLYGVTEPLLYQVRRRVPFVFAGGIDLSPIIVLVAIMFLRMVVVQTLFELSFRIRAELPRVGWFA